MNDTYIIVSVISVFIILGVFLPFVNEEFERSSSATDISTFTNKLSSEGGSIENDTSLLKIIMTTASMFFWTFGALPFWLDGLFMIVRIVFFYTIAKHIRGVG